eukprot:jgi/Astpho2/6039/Aster-x0711
MLRRGAAQLIRPLRAQCFNEALQIRGLKNTTGITGIDVDPQGRQNAASKLQEIVNSDLPDDDVEEQLAAQLEELILLCNDELDLIPQMAEWAPWDVPEGHTIESIREEDVDVKAGGGPATQTPAPPPPPKK